MARCSLLELNETRNDSERKSFLSKIFFDNLLLKVAGIGFQHFQAFFSSYTFDGSVLEIFIS